MDWIRVKDEKPPLPSPSCKGLRIFVWIKHPGQEGGFSSEAVHTVHGDIKVDGCDVGEFITHWMRMPGRP